MKTLDTKKISDNKELDSKSLDYRAIIKHHIHLNKDQRGYQKKLADAAGCQASHLSQVLNSDIQLTPDQAAGLCHFWDYDDDQTELFINLVLLDRSTSNHLAKRLTRRISTLRGTKLTMKDRIKDTAEIPHESFVAEYYSAWFWPAIHMLMIIPQFETPEKIAHHLKLDVGLVKSCTNRLVGAGVVLKTPQGWKGNKNFHLPDSSPLIVGFHNNWRQQAIRNFQERRKDNIHFTAIYSLNASDFEGLRIKIMDLIEKTREAAMSSDNEEMIACLKL